MDPSIDSRSNDSSPLYGSTMCCHRQDDILIRGKNIRGSSLGNLLSSRSQENGMDRSSDAYWRKETARTFIMLFVCDWIKNDRVWRNERKEDSS